MEKELIEKRLEELNKRMEELEEINIKFMNEGKEEEFNLKYGIEYENISDEMYRQRINLENLKEEENKGT